jgi:hypothetical protein
VREQLRKSFKAQLQNVTARLEQQELAQDRELLDERDRYKHRTLILQGEYSKLRMDFDMLVSAVNRAAQYLASADNDDPAEDVRLLLQQLKGCPCSM